MWVVWSGPPGPTVVVDEFAQKGERTKEGALRRNLMWEKRPSSFKLPHILEIEMQSVSMDRRTHAGHPASSLVIIYIDIKLP